MVVAHTPHTRPLNLDAYVDTDLFVPLMLSFSELPDCCFMLASSAFDIAAVCIIVLSFTVLRQCFRECLQYSAVMDVTRFIPNLFSKSQ